MPTYEYACRSCGEHVEAVQSFTDEPLTECPHCGGALRKVFGSIGITFKGSGFYKTDSRRGGTSSSESSGGATTEAKPDGAAAKTDTKVDTKADAKSGTKADKKSDAKPASKTEAKSA